MIHSSLFWIFLLFASVSAAEAATIAVTTTADELNADGDCSLREAVRAANLNAAVDGCPAGTGADVVTLPAGTYTLSVGPAGDDASLTGDLDVVGDLEINGAGSSASVIDGGGMDRVFHFDPFGVGTFNIVLSDLTVRNGNAGTGNGGGILKNSSTATFNRVTVTGNTTTGVGCGIRSNGGTLTLNDSVVSANTGACINGAGITAGSTLILNRTRVTGNSTTVSSACGGVLSTGGNSLTLIDSTVSGNTASGSFSTGGVRNSGDLTIIGSTVSGNTAGGNGGGIDFSGATLIITNSTISGNTSPSVGGGLRFSGLAGFLNNVTITANRGNTGATSGSRSGGVDIESGILTVRNSLIAGNTVSASDSPDCDGIIVSRGYNLIGDPTGCTIDGDATGVLTGVSSGLAGLAENGGPSPTHALLAGSPAFDAGDPAGCRNQEGDPLPTDQRGFARGATRCDIGAFEIVCGDALVQDFAGEQCDDGNTAGGDGCSAVCAVETSAAVPVAEIPVDEVPVAAPADEAPTDGGEVGESPEIPSAEGPSEGTAKAGGGCSLIR